ncbi:MAG: glycerate kinase [Gemmatimonadota bacterium]
MTSSGTTSVIVAPTAFKGTLGPSAVAGAMAAGVAAVWPAAEVVQRPLSDGGNGLLEAWVAMHGGVLETVEVMGPMGSPTRASFLRAGSTAVVESAEACGLHLIPAGRRDPLRATTRGVGELLRAAVRGGASEIILGLGGSGTVDGGAGMARALGWRLLDAAGRELEPGGGALVHLRSVQPPRDGLESRVVALCDVENPLVGPRGAARIFGPQKGARPDEVALLEEGLCRLAVVQEADLGLALADLPGAGAAGGLGAGARAFLGAELVQGAPWMIERAGIRELMERADLIITGEGRFDAQSAMGKVTGRIVDAARSAGVRVLLVCGRVDGPIPPGVEAVDAGGRALDEQDLARLTEGACRGLAGGDRL